jgi:hypothetical protein
MELVSLLPPEYLRVTDRYQAMQIKKARKQCVEVAVKGRIFPRNTFSEVFVIHEVKRNPNFFSRDIHVIAYLRFCHFVHKHCLRDKPDDRQQ